MNVNIWIAAGTILGAAIALGAAIVAKIALREVKDLRGRDIQLPLPPAPKKEEDKRLQPV